MRLLSSQHTIKDECILLCNNNSVVRQIDSTNTKVHCVFKDVYSHAESWKYDPDYDQLKSLKDARTVPFDNARYMLCTSYP